MRLPKRLSVVLACTILMGCSEAPTEPCEMSVVGRILDGLVHDQFGARVNGVKLFLTRDSDGSVRESFTPGTLGNGHFVFFSVDTGQYTLGLVPPPGYTVPSHQPNPISVTVREGCNDATSVRLAITLHKE
jgi:hypothetical protein